MLSDLVKAGKLPPVEQRLPAEPVVIKPTRKVGKYGGIAYGEGIDVNVTHDMQIVNTAGLFAFNNDLSVLTPAVASSWKFSADYKTATIVFRKGMKWSDGTPFTTDDVMFFFEDMIFDKGYTPVLPTWCQQGGQPMKVTKVDDNTVQFDFAIPNPASTYCRRQAGRLSPGGPRNSSPLYSRSTIPMPTRRPRRRATRAGRPSSSSSPFLPGTTARCSLR